MSIFVNIHDEDIDIDKNNREVNVYITVNEWGKVYGVLTFDQIIDAYRKIMSDEE